MTNSARIAIITPIMPYPPDSGSRLRIYHLSRLMAHKGFKLFLLSLDPNSPDAVPAKLKECFDDVQIITPPLTIESSSRIRGWRNKLSPKPFSIRPGLAEKIDLTLRTWKPDFIQVEKTIGAAYLDISSLRKRGIRCIWEEGGVHHLSYEREALIKESYLARLFCKIRSRRLKAFETRILRLIDAVVAVSAEEARLLKSMNAQVRILLVPNGVDESIILEDSSPLEKRQCASFFCGDLKYKPNRDAVEYYINEIMPRLFAKGILLDFVVAGANIPDSLANQTHLNPHVKLLGYVDNIYSLFKKYAIFVNPMRLGGGTRLKMLEAMACGMACVSTKVGAEGILIENRKHALVSESPMSVAENIEFLISHPRQAAELGRSARDLIVKEYLWPKCASSLISYYEKGISPRGNSSE